MKRISVSAHFLTFSCLAVLLLYTACKDNVNTMLDDYNGHYEPATNMELIKNPGDSGFDQKKMLDDLYTVSSEGNINLAAPYNCKSYSWFFYKTINKIQRESGESAIDTELVDITDKLDFYPGCGKNMREFRAYVPTSQLEAGVFLGAGTYILRLVVIGNDNQKYTDWCKIIIYEQIFGQTNFFKEE